MKKKYLFFISQDYSFSVLRPLQKKILERGDSVKWFLYGDEVTYSYLNLDEERLLTVEEINEFNPDAVFVPGNVVPSFISGLKVEVFHGLPSTKAKKNGQLYHYIIRGMFDLYCTQGPDSTSKFNQLSLKYGYFKVKETGWCKLDPLFWRDNSVDDSQEKTIFFASTFSPRFSKAKILYPVILEMMKKYDFNWYITLHPKMDKDIVKLYKGIDLKNVRFIEQSEVIDCFKKADMMLCDTSSIIYEFLTQIKPVVTFQTQKNESSLINVEELDKLEETILSVFNHEIDNSENIKNSVEKFHPYTDGKSSERVLNAVEEMLDGKNLPTKKKPLNLIRNFRLRRELNYWKFI